MAEEQNKQTQEVRKEEKKENIELEREYIVPLRKGIMKAPEYKRSKKAVKVLKEFIAKHMKVEDRDTRNVKINKYLNNEIWHRGKTNPPTKIKVKAVKKDGIVYVELAEIPKALQYKMDKDKKIAERTTQMQNTEKKEEKKEETKEEKINEKEKEKATVEAGKKETKLESKQEKHTSSVKQGKAQPIHRMAMQK